MFSPQDEQEIKERLAPITQDVRLLLFTRSLDCETCPETESLLKELSGLSERIKLEILNPFVDRDRAEQYGVTEVPTLILEGDRDYGIRYLGMPGGYEFASLLEDVVAIGKRESGLSEGSKELVRTLTEPLDLKVFVTPG
jgi:alkyl hydroperoxide reductase subunit AhpF